ncbi:MAG TPA: aldose epimerase family protein [Steroidobacteraceae bacterium]|nr:aldose epimerase family protein [Steroidobacteraceae bacterium]
MRIVGATLLTTLLAFAATATAADARRIPFGKLADGTPIEAVELTNGRGITARVMTLGATLQALSVPDRDGRSDDIVLGYATAAAYLENPQYFGASVGRYANRIAHGRFSLDGRDYQLETNDGANHLHGGRLGFDKRVWKIESVESGSPARVVLAYESADGEGGYPGKLRALATYSLDDRNALSIAYRAATDRPTIVNLTNHSYFNLGGEASGRDTLGERLTLLADAYTPVDATLIPTGERRPVAGTPFDFRAGAIIGERIRDGSDPQLVVGRGYDHNFIVTGAGGSSERLAARLEDPVTGRVMELWTIAPGLQFYSGNFLNGTVVGKGRRVYRQGDGLCLEPQVFPDAPNHPDFPSARLDAGQSYRNAMTLRFSVTKS